MTDKNEIKSQRELRDFCLGVLVDAFEIGTKQDEQKDQIEDLREEVQQLRKAIEAQENEKPKESVHKAVPNSICRNLSWFLFCQESEIAAGASGKYGLLYDVFEFFIGRPPQTGD
jgi:hypothetical protein